MLIVPHIREMIFLTVILTDTTKVARTNVTGCYDETTNIKLNLNTYTLTLGLNPTNKTECHAIEQSVIVNLTLHANNYICDNITLVLLNFSYINSTSIEFNFYKDTINVFNIDDVFCNASLAQDQYLQGMPQLTFAFVQIYTHSHIMSTEVMEYSQVKTNISGCFERLFVQMTDDYKLQLNVTPTLICKNLMNKKSNTSTDNVITGMELTFGEVTFVVNDTEMNTIIDNYNNLQMASVNITGKDKVKQVAESDYNNGQLKITTIQNNVSVQILYNIEFSQASVRTFYEYAVFTASKDMMYFQFDADKNVVDQINKDTNLPFASYKLKLIITQGTEYLTYQQVNNSKIFNPDNDVWTIDCTAMTGYQKERCQNYSLYMQNSKDVDVQLYVGFYDEDDKFIFHEQVKMQQYLSCITELEVRYVNNSIVKTRYFLEELEVCKPYQNYTLRSARLLVADGTFAGDMAQLYLTNSSLNEKLSGNVEFRCVEGEPCNINKQFVTLGQKNYVVLQLTLVGPENQNITFAALTNKLSLQNDIIISYPAFAIGAASLAACLILTLYGMVMTMKRVKLIKKKKLKL